MLFFCLESSLFIWSTCRDSTYTSLLGLQRDFFSQRGCWEATGIPGTCQQRKFSHWSSVRCWAADTLWQASLMQSACPWLAPALLDCHPPQNLAISPSSQASGTLHSLHWETSEASIHDWNPSGKTLTYSLFYHDPLHLLLNNKNAGLTTFPICVLIRAFLYTH